MGLKNLATLSNGLEIANLDLKREDEQIKKISKETFTSKIPKQKYYQKNPKKNTTNG